LPAGVDRYGRMQIRRRWQAQAGLQEDLPRGRREKVGAANDIGNALFGIVHDDSELVGVKSIRPPQYEVADVVLETLRLRPLQAVVVSDRCVVHTQAKSALKPSRVRARHAGAARARIDVFSSRSDGRRCKLAPRTSAFINSTDGTESFESVLVAVEP